MTDTQRGAFEAWLRKCPDARFWNTTDAMLAAWQAALTQPQAQQAAAVPDGWKLVPIEPTKKMVEAAYDNVTGGGGRAAIYAAMLSSAPAAPQAQGWSDLANHLRYCRECGETDVMQCSEGWSLWKAVHPSAGGEA